MLSPIRWLNWSRRLFLIFLSCTVSLGRSKEDKPFLRLQALSNITSHRQNICGFQDDFFFRRIPLRDALEGLAMQPILTEDRFFQLDENGAIDDLVYPGIYPEILDELAVRAKFTWRDSFAVTSPPNTAAGETWTQLLNWSATNFDLSLNWWLPNPERLAMGIIYPEGWYDASIIMVAVQEDQAAEEWNLNGWFLPFEWTIWVLIAATIILSGMAFVLLERIERQPGQVHEDGAASQTFYNSSMMFVGHLQYDPRTNATKLTSFSLAFLSLLLIAAYTANLVNFLVSENKPRLDINSVDEAVASNLPMCVVGTSAMDVAVSTTYHQIKLIRVKDEVAGYKALLARECTVMLTTVSSWQEFERNRDINGGCNLKFIGQPFSVQKGGFASVSDSGTLCTSLIRDVINLHLTEMKADGFLDFLWGNYLTRHQGIDCALEAKGNEGSTPQLGLRNLLGTFLVHFSAMAISIVWALVSRRQRNARLLKEASSAVPDADMIRPGIRDSMTQTSSQTTPKPARTRRQTIDVAETSHTHTATSRYAGKIFNEGTSRSFANDPDPLRGLHKLLAEKELRDKQWLEEKDARDKLWQNEKELRDKQWLEEKDARDKQLQNEKELRDKQWLEEKDARDKQLQEEIYLLLDKVSNVPSESTEQSSGKSACFDEGPQIHVMPLHPFDDEPSESLSESRKSSKSTEQLRNHVAKECWW